MHKRQQYCLIYRNKQNEEFYGFVLNIFEQAQLIHYRKQWLNKYALLLKECKGRHSVILSFQSDIPLALLRNLVFLLDLVQDLACSVTTCPALALLSH